MTALGVPGRWQPSKLISPETCHVVQREGFKPPQAARAAVSTVSRRPAPAQSGPEALCNRSFQRLAWRRTASTHLQARRYSGSYGGDCSLRARGLLRFRCREGVAVVPGIPAGPAVHCPPTCTDSTATSGSSDGFSVVQPGGHISGWADGISPKAPVMVRHVPHPTVATCSSESSAVGMA